MKIIRHDIELTIDQKIIGYEKKLKENRILTLESIDHVDHIAAYIAWTNVGGNIFIKNPLNPIEQKLYLDKAVNELSCSNSIIFNTSGTTGVPKIVINTNSQITQCANMSTQELHWEPNTKFLNFIPAFTTGFWHIILPAFVKNQSTLILGSRETVSKDLECNADLSILVPAMLDQIRIRKIPVNFSKFQRICSGASAVFERHAKFFFDNKGTIFTHCYGASEIGSPILTRSSNSIDDFPTYLNFSAIGENQLKLIDRELHVLGKSVCENFKDEWYPTGDLFDQKGELLKFVGRSNEIVKINGFAGSLLLIENTIEERLGLGDTLAIVKNSKGNDYVELLYTNSDAKINKKEFRNMLTSALPKCCIPIKYTQVGAIKKNALGKKIR